MAKVSKWSGLTVHTGWIPMLAAQGPAHAFSKSKSNRGVAARGYNKKFAQQVQAIAEQRRRGQSGSLRTLLKTPIITELGMEAVLGGMPFPSGQGNLLTGERLLRGRKWSDVVKPPRQGSSGRATYNAASRYEEATKKFQLRGNFVWYNKPTGTPKQLAEAILDNDYNFGEGEKWYNRSRGPPSKIYNWALETLGMEGSEIVTPAEVESIGMSAAETILKDGPYKVNEDVYGDTKAKKRDIKMKDNFLTKGARGEITETDIKEESHGITKGADTSSTEALYNFMDSKVVAEWNKIITKVIDSERKKMAKGLKFKKGSEGGKNIPTKAVAKSAIAKSAGKLIRQAGLNATEEQMRKVSHEIAASVYGDTAGLTSSFWTDVLGAGVRKSKNGLRDYAAVRMELTKDFKFVLRGVNIIEAVDAGAALIKNEKRWRLFSTKQHSLRQQIAFAHNFGLNTDSVSRHGALTTQGFNNVNKGVAVKTQVSFSPKVAKDYINNIIDRFGEIIEDDLRGREAEVQAAVLSKAERYKKKGSIFWASPFIGIEEGLKLT